MYWAWCKCRHRLEPSLSKNSLGITRVMLGVYIQREGSYESWEMGHSGV